MKCMETVISHTSNNALKPIILAPPVEKCGGSRLRMEMDSRPCFPLVYTLKGTYIAALFHGVCRICKMRFYYGYREMKEMKSFECIIVHMILKNIFSFPVVLCMKNSSVTHNVVFSACTFKSRADTYRANDKIIDQRRLIQYDKYQRNTCTEWCPSSQRIEEAWFMWVLVLLYHEQGNLSCTNLHTNFGQISKRREPL